MTGSTRIEGASIQIQHHRLARGIGWAAALLFCAPLLAFAVLQGLGAVPPFPGLGEILFTSPLVALLGLIVRGFRWRRNGALEITGEDLVIERGASRARIPLAQIASAWLSPLEAEVEIHKKSGDVVRARLPSAADGQRLLEAAGLDASRRTMRMQLGETTFLTWLTVLIGPALVVPLTTAVAGVAPWPSPLNVFVFIGLFYLLHRAVRATFGPAEVVIGADGLIIRQGLGQRFLPHARITQIDVGHERCLFQLDDGSTVRTRARHLTNAQIELLRARLEDAIAAWRAGTDDDASLARLDRNGRSRSSWREAVGAILERPEGYRAAVITREQLVRVLENAGAPAERRLGAAMALSASKEPDDRARIRVAALACANRRMAVALEQAAGGALDDDALEEALAAEEVAEKGRATRDRTARR